MGRLSVTSATMSTVWLSRMLGGNGFRFLMFSNTRTRVGKNALENNLSNYDPISSGPGALIQESFSMASAISDSRIGQFMMSPFSSCTVGEPRITDSKECSSTASFRSSFL